MTLDDAIEQLTQMKKDGVPGNTKLNGGFSIGFQHFDFDLDFFDDTDYETEDIAVCLKNIRQKGW